MCCELDLQVVTVLFVALLEETARLRERCELNELQYERHLRALRSEKHALEQRVETIVEEKHGICVQHAEQLDRLHEEIDCLQKQLKKMKTFIDVRIFLHYYTSFSGTASFKVERWHFNLKTFELYSTVVLRIRLQLLLALSNLLNTNKNSIYIVLTTLLIQPAIFCRESTVSKRCRDRLENAMSRYTSYCAFCLNIVFLLFYFVAIHTVSVQTFLYKRVMN